MAVASAYGMEAASAQYCHSCSPTIHCFNSGAREHVICKGSTTFDRYIDCMQQQCQMQWIQHWVEDLKGQFPFPRM